MHGAAPCLSPPCIKPHAFNDDHFRQTLSHVPCISTPLYATLPWPLMEGSGSRRVYEASKRKPLSRTRFVLSVRACASIDEKTEQDAIRELDLEA